MERRILETIRKYALIQRGQRIGVAVSGGRDSMALLTILKSLCEELQCGLVCLHMEHGIRGDASRMDAEFVRKYAEKQGIPCLTERYNIPEYAKEKRMNLEQAAREKRYAFFNRQIFQGVVDRVALAHHRNDQEETVLLHLLRGSGIKGLCGMQFYREPGIIRPLLDISREEIDRYVEENHIPFREDQTNQDIMLRRNYIRLEVMPRLKQINEQAGRNIARMASVAAVDDAFLESETQKRYDRLVTRDKNGVTIARAGYREEPLAMRWRLLRRILEQDFSLKNIEQKHIELLDEFARQAGTGKKLDIKYEVFATISYGRLIICRKTAKIETNSAIFPLLEETVLPDGAVLVYSEATLPEDFPKNESTEQWAAGDALEGAVIRKRLPGDRFRPFGSKKAKKLKDWMIDKKIERNRRDTLWLLAKEGKVLWVPGYGMGEELRITQDTKKIYKISYIEGEIK